MFWIGRVRGARSELIRWAVSDNFRKITFRDLTAFFSFLMRNEILCFSNILIKEYVEAYLNVQILLILMEVDFSERRPEQVISFFWRSVYITSRDTEDFVGCPAEGP